MWTFYNIVQGRSPHSGDESRASGQAGVNEPLIAPTGAKITSKMRAVDRL
jgi:hypothetical protein